MKIVADSSLNGRTPVVRDNFHYYPGLGPKALHKLASERIDFKPYTFLATSYNNDEMLDFLKRKTESGLSEYILIRNNTMIILKGSIDLKQYNKMEKIAESILKHL